MRAVARTTLALGDLLEIPIGIASATGSRDVRFDTAFPDGVARVQQFVHPEHERTMYEPPTDAPTLGDVLEAENTVELAAWAHALTPVDVPEVIHETVKGVRVGDRFRVVPPSELEYASAATHLDTVELLEFIDYRRVPTDRLTGSFYIQPDPGFAKPLRVVIEAMRAEGKAMLVKWSVKTRQRLGVIRAREIDGAWVLLLNGVVFAADWRKPDEKVLEPAQVEAVDERAVNAARQIIRSHAGTGEALEKAADDLPGLLTEVVARAHDGTFDDPVQVLMLAADFRDEGFATRADELVAWAENRWPKLAEQRKALTRVIAEGGDADRLADIAATILA
jgi:non-homologous end joining protein Ku